MQKDNFWNETLAAKVEAIGHQAAEYALICCLLPNEREKALLKSTIEERKKTVEKIGNVIYTTPETFL